MPFKSELEGRFLGNDKWQLTKVLIYETLSGNLIIVPQGFISNGASIPRFFWRLIGSPWSGKYGRAAVVHDYMCFAEKVPRKQADKIFLEIMQELGVSWWRRGVMYWAVRVAGIFSR